MKTTIPMLLLCLLVMACSGHVITVDTIEANGGAAGSAPQSAQAGASGAGQGGAGGSPMVCPEHHHEAAGSCVCDEGLILDAGEPCPETFTLTGSGRCWCPLTAS